MSGKLILYSQEFSPAVRTVQLTVNALGIEIENKIVDVLALDLYAEEFLKKNPEHSIPLLEFEDGRNIGDSHAIASYLVERFAPNDSLYPKDLYLRAQVDRFLYFDSGLLFSELKKMILALYGSKPNDSIPEHYNQHFEVNFEILDIFLKDREYIIGDQFNIADLSLLATISSIDILFPLNVEKFPNLARWFNNLKNLPYYEKANQRGVYCFKEFINGFMKNKL